MKGIPGMQRERSSIVLNILALLFSLVGAATLLAFPIGLARGLAEGTSIVLIMLSIVYGALALAVGVLLYRRSEVAPRAFLIWCVALGIFVIAMPEMRIPLAIPGYVFGLVLFSWLYIFISRHLSSKPGAGRSPAGT